MSLLSITSAIIAFALFSEVAAADEPIRVSDLAVIFLAADAHKFVKQCSRTSPEAITGFWTPTLSEVSLVEKALPAFVAGKAAGLRHPVSAFRRQYAGLISKGRKIIYINALLAAYFEESDRDSNARDWKKQPMMVCDGGSAFWGVEFDLLEKRFQHFSANGAPFGPP
jgi:hypothetical protein